MAYEFTTDKRGNRKFSRVGTRVRAVPKGKVTIEPAKTATVAKVDIDSGETVAVEPVAVETAAVEVPTTPKPKAKKTDG